MARHAGPRTVQCYHCRHRFEVGGRAQSTSCPGCNKAVIVSDIEVKSGVLRGPLREDRTCGRVIVHKRGRLIVDKLEAHGGIEVYGTLDAKQVISGKPVLLDAKCQFKGNLKAPGVDMKLGAKVHGEFSVPDDPLGLGDLP